MKNLPHSLRKVWHFAESNSGWFLIVGLATTVAYNAFQYRKDKNHLEKVNNQRFDIPPLNSSPRVSVLLPAWNESEMLADCIHSILALSYANIELVVCAGGSDNSLEISRTFSSENVIVLEQHLGDGKQGALKRCFEISKGEIIFLTDSDCILNDEVFERTLAPLINDGENAATGTWRPLDRQVDIPFVQYQWSHHVYREVWMAEYAPTLDGRNSAIKRDALEEVGAFEIPASIGTDYVLSKQLVNAGYRIRFVRNSNVQTEYPQTFTAYSRQISRWFRNHLVQGPLWREKSLVFSLIRSRISSSLLLVIPFTPAIKRPLIRAGWISVIFHLWLSASRNFGILELKNKSVFQPDRYLQLLIYLSVSLFAVTKGLVDFFLPSRRESW